MPNVPNTTTFCFADVQAAVGGTCLTTAITNAGSTGWDATYCGTKTCLLNFRNYTSAVAHSVNYLALVNTGTNTVTRCMVNCIQASPAMGSGEVYCPLICWNLQTSSNCNVSTSVKVYKGATLCYDCTVTACGQFCNGSYVAVISPSETWCVDLCMARVAGAGQEASAAAACLWSITSSTGLYSIVATSNFGGYTCGAIP